jgi:6-phosphogluconate dehydrogenase
MSEQKTAEQKLNVGIIGLGSMGSNIAEVLLKNGYSIIAYDRSDSRRASFSDNDVPAEWSNVYTTKNLQDFAEKVQSSGDSHIIWMMIPGGEPTNQMAEALAANLHEGSIVIDGSNSDYNDSIANSKMLSAKGIAYLDAGIAGGPSDLLTGVSIMVGGERTAFEKAEPLLKAVSGNGSYGYVGSSGSGHMLKAVHNTIFYSIFPMYSEAVSVLASNVDPAKFDVAESLRLLSVAPPINAGIMKAIAEAHRKGDFENDAKKASVSKMVSSFVENAEKSGARMDLTMQVLQGYPSMRDGTLRVYSSAKKILTGH